jgi:putative FmdB family regulatory protein
MPIYEYRCQTCNAVSEAFVRSGKEPTACPECGAETLSRLISRAGVIFKGSGFYVTDTKVASSSASTSGDKSDSTPTSKSDDSKGSSEKPSTTTATESSSSSSTPSPD